MDGFIYNCPIRCPIKKHCFVIKTEHELEEPLSVLYKCTAEKGKDICIEIGGNKKHERPP